MATDNRYRGILRTDYEAAQARLKGFVPMTIDEAQLLHHLAEEERLLPLWENHVLTVLADIHRKKLSGYAGVLPMHKVQQRQRSVRRSSSGTSMAGTDGWRLTLT